MMNRLLTGLLFLTSLAAVTHSGKLNPLSSHGTIIVLLPMRDGLIVAADSRSDISNGKDVIHCDSGVKIVTLKKHPRTVVAVAGMDKTFVHVSAGSCAYLMSSIPILNLKEIVSSYLDRQRSEMNAKVIAGLEAHLLQKIKAVQVEYPGLLRNGGDGRTFATIVVGRCVPDEHLSMYAKFRICILAGDRAEICDKDGHEYHLVDKPQPIIFGEGFDIVTKHVFPPEGQRMLGPQHLRNFWLYIKFPTIGDVPTETCTKAAADLIESAEIMSDNLPENTVWAVQHTSSCWMNAASLTLSNRSGVTQNKKPPSNIEGGPVSCGSYLFIDPAIARSRCALDRARLCLPFAIDAFSSADDTVTVCFGAGGSVSFRTIDVHPSPGKIRRGRNSQAGAS